MSVLAGETPVVPGRGGSGNIISGGARAGCCGRERKQ
jgi:hypothetical protein